jgi:hypothetical protein
VARDQSRPTLKPIIFALHLENPVFHFGAGVGINVLFSYFPESVHGWIWDYSFHIKGREFPKMPL